MRLSVLVDLPEKPYGQADTGFYVWIIQSSRECMSRQELQKKVRYDLLSINMQKHKPLRELVYEELRMLIMTGQIKPGTRMMEIDLAESMGVSRTPVREAIRQLEKDNLVTIEPRRGAYVSDISAPDMADMLHVREPLEGLATLLATRNMTDEELKELADINLQYEKAFEQGEREQLITLDTRFHNRIAEGSRNTYLVSVLKNLQEQVLRFRYIYFQSGKRAADVISEHRLILDNMIDRNEKAAENYSKEHIIKLRESIMKEEDFNTKTVR